MYCLNKICLLDWLDAQIFNLDARLKGKITLQRQRHYASRLTAFQELKAKIEKGEFDGCAAKAAQAQTKVQLPAESPLFQLKGVP